jgi:hypothetical protein
MSTKPKLDGVAFTISYSALDLEGVLKKGKVDSKALNACIRDKMVKAILINFHGVDEKELGDVLPMFRLRFMRKYRPSGRREQSLVIMRYKYGKSKRTYTKRLFFLPQNDSTTLTGKFIA